MITHSYSIEYSKSEPIKILPISDVHIGAKTCDEKGFKAWLEKNSGAYILGNGDLMDMVIASDSKRYRKSSDGTDGDDIVDEQIMRIYKMLAPFKGRIIGLGTGNHEDSITKHCGTNPMKRLCGMLECTFLGYTSLTRVFFRPGKTHACSIDIYMTHGWGGGSRTQGADLTKFSKHIGSWDADVYLFGHVHRKQSDRIPRLGWSQNKVVSRPQLVGITGGWLKTLSDDTNPTYAEIKGYAPNELGGLVLNVKPNHGKRCEFYFDN